MLKYRKLSPLANEPVMIDGSAGIDLCSPISTIIKPKETVKISLDLAFEIPEGFYGRIAGRSGISTKYSIDVLGGFSH